MSLLKYKRPLLLITTVPGLEEQLFREACEELGYRPGGVFRRLSGRVYLALNSIGDANVVRRLLLAENARLLFGEGGSLEEVVVEMLEDIKKVLDGAAAFSVVSERITKENELVSPEISARVGERISRLTGRYVALDFPDVVFYVEWVSGRYRFGIDLTGFRGLRDRPYRLYVHRSSLNPIIAAAMCRLAKGGKSVFDPFCGSGTIIAECLNQGFEELFCSDVRGNAVMGARLNLSLLRSKALVHLLTSDALYRVLRSGVDAIITNPPFGIREKPIGGLNRVYRSILENASALDAKLVVVLSNRRKLLYRFAGEYGYSLSRSIPLNEGGIRSWILVFKKASLLSLS